MWPGAGSHAHERQAPRPRAPGASAALPPASLGGTCVTSLHFLCSPPPRGEVVPLPGWPRRPRARQPANPEGLSGPVHGPEPSERPSNTPQTRLPPGAAAQVVPARGRLMGSSAAGARGWRPRRCRSRRATQQPEAQVSGSGRRAAPLHTAVHWRPTAGPPGGELPGRRGCPNRAPGSQAL